MNADWWLPGVGEGGNGEKNGIMAMGFYILKLNRSGGWTTL